MLALLYDVHGNLPALEAVLDDAHARGVQAFLLGGDYALFGAWPAQTVARLRRLPRTTWIRGNVDRWTAGLDEANDDPDLRRAVDFARDALGSRDADWLGTLAQSVQVQPGVRAWHASPVSDMRSFMPQAAEDEGGLLEGVADHRLVFGHTHLQFQRASVVDGIELVNPGSVGMPLDGDHRAAYAILGPEGAMEPHRVTYDHHEAAAAVRRADPGAAWSETAHARLCGAGLG